MGWPRRPLVVTLEQTFTPAARSLRKMGEHQRLRDLRLLFQYAELPAFREPVERLSGRQVRAFISGIDTEADVASEMFVLHPDGYDGPNRHHNEGPEGRTRPRATRRRARRESHRARDPKAASEETTRPSVALRSRFPGWPGDKPHNRNLA